MVVKKKISGQPIQTTTFWPCENTGHDFFQVLGENNLTAHTLGQLAFVNPKPPKVICRKCGEIRTIN